MKKVLMLVWFMNLVPLYMWAQKTNWKPMASAEAGFQAGNYEASAEWRLRAGVQKGDWQLGLGSGVDYYRFRSIPVLLTGQYNLGAKKQKPFLLAAGGINIADPLEEQKNWYYNNGDFDASPIFRWNPGKERNYQNGYMAELGAGYAFYGRRGHGVQIALVHNIKSVKEWFPAIAYGGNGERSSYTESLTYTMHRMVIRVAYKW